MSARLDTPDKSYLGLKDINPICETSIYGEGWRKSQWRFRATRYDTEARFSVETFSLQSKSMAERQKNSGLSHHESLLKFGNDLESRAQRIEKETLLDVK